MNIVGENGSGKSKLARWIAQRLGWYAEIEASMLDSHFRFGTLLSSEPATLIIDWEYPSANALDVLKDLLTHKEIEIQAVGLESRIVRTPLIIVCSSEPLAIESLYVVTLS